MDDVMVNFGAGRRPFRGWVNVDVRPGNDIDYVCQLDGSGWMLGQRDFDSVDRMAAIHVLEHLKYPLEFMYMAWMYAKDGARMDIVVPHGANDEAWGDATHVRPYFETSFDYFSRPMHWMNPQAGYKGDWEVVETIHIVNDVDFAECNHPERGEQYRQFVVKEARNHITMLHVVMKAVKPARDNTLLALQEMQETENVRRKIRTIEQYFAENPEYMQFHLNPNEIWGEDGELVDHGFRWSNV